jgi:hypothetical protein
MGSLPPPQNFESNYPRSGEVAESYARSPGVYLDAISVGYRMSRNGPWAYFLSTLIVCFAVFVGFVAFIAVFAGFGVSPEPFSHGYNPFAATISLNIVPAVSIIVLQIFCQFALLCLTGLGVKGATGARPSVADLFIPFKHFGKSFVATALAAAPGIILMLIVNALFELAANDPFNGQPSLHQEAQVVSLTAFAAYLIVLGPMKIGACAAIFSDLPVRTAYAEAFRRTGMKAILLSLVLALAGLFAALGLFIGCAGILLTLVGYTNAVALHYTFYFPPEPPGQMSASASPAVPPASETPSEEWGPVG